MWNVNQKQELQEFQNLLELIETLWNVNVSSGSNVTINGQRINRNIVECKYDWNIVTRYGTYELIETLWNVNTVCLDELTEEQIELIETLWNVNAW